MFEAFRTKTRPAVLELAATFLAALLVVFSLGGAIVSLVNAGDVLRASQAFAQRPKASHAVAVELVSAPAVIAPSADNSHGRSGLSGSSGEFGHGQPPEPTIECDVPVDCPDPSLCNDRCDQSALTGSRPPASGARGAEPDCGGGGAPRMVRPSDRAL